MLVVMVVQVCRRHRMSAMVVPLGLIRSLPVEVFKSQRSPESADAGGSGAGLSAAAQ